MHDYTIAGNVRGTHASSGPGSKPSAVSMILIIRQMTHEVIMFKFESNLDHKGVFMVYIRIPVHVECIPVRYVLVDGPFKGVLFRVKLGA